MTGKQFVLVALAVFVGTVAAHLVAAKVIDSEIQSRTASSGGLLGGVVDALLGR